MANDQQQTTTELTFRGLALGFVLTLLFVAANVFLGLRVGLTFATSIPAAVISMAVLKPFRDSSILENNIVQTVASAAGTLAAVIFVLPGLVLLGWWTVFPFWQTMTICLAGGVLGVMFSIPLRRALVTGSALPFPEGRAAAEILKAGSQEGGDSARLEARAGLVALAIGSVFSAGYALLANMKLVADHVAAWFRVGRGATGLDFGLSFALFGVGHLVGLSVGLAMAVGVLIAFGVATPLLTAGGTIGGTAEAAALDVWSHQVRFIGAGLIGVAALWQLGRLILPIARGLKEAAEASRVRRHGGMSTLPEIERDMPIALVGLISAATMLPIGVLIVQFAGGGPLAPLTVPLTLAGLLYVLFASVVVASVSGYMAGLIGSSNSPISGIGILAVVGAALLLLFGIAPLATADAGPQLTAFAIFVTAIIFAAAAVSNDNLQDLKTGQLVGATPWKQQAALIVGVAAGAITIPFVLNLLNEAYGFGAPSAEHANPLPAPQAVLITALAKGVLGRGLDWSLIGIGGAIGAFMILLDGLAGRRGLMRLPPLAVGIGIYLPMSATLPVIAGAVIGTVWRRRHPSERAERLGVLLASGMIVGESLFGVAIAALIVLTGSAAPLAVAGNELAFWATAGGVLMFVAAIAWVYRRTAQLAG